MQINMVSVWDPVWIRGEVDCPAPVFSPHFRHDCVHYNYKLEEYVQRTRTKSDGKTETYYEWETRETKQDTAPFAVVQGEWQLHVDVARAQWHYQLSSSETLGNWRHSCSYVSASQQVSVIGVVGEQKKTLEPLMHVPLIVTPRERQSYLKSAESAERWVARGGLVMLFAGVLFLLYGVLSHDSAQPAGAPMNTAALPIALGLAFLATFLLWGFRVYNSLVIFRTRADQSWSSIDVHLKQRYDLVPNLIAVVQAYLKHEQELLESLTRLRTQAYEGGREQRVEAESGIVGNLTRLCSVVESYPDLKGDQQFRLLAQKITALEDKIAHARSFFNDSVAEYNSQVLAFPANLVAGLFGFKRYAQFSAELQERAAPRFRLSDEPVKEVTS
jgi:LemA protein